MHGWCLDRCPAHVLLEVHPKWEFDDHAYGNGSWVEEDEDEDNCMTFSSIPP